MPPKTQINAKLGLQILIFLDKTSLRLINISLRVEKLAYFLQIPDSPDPNLNPNQE
jgi:hypothetical protein